MSENRYPYVHVRCTEESAELLSDQLWVLGASGVEERDATTMSAAQDVLLIASFASEEAAQAALSALRSRAVDASIEHVVGDAWRDAWRDYFHPTRVSPRLLLRPSWREVSEEEGVFVLTIDPGAAFGSGIHETTRLCMQHLDAVLRGGERVLDVGCGSGILSIAAILLGAQYAEGIDIDEDAIAVSIENSGFNHVSAQTAFSTQDVREVEGRFEVVVANIQTPILIPMRDALLARVLPGGALILSGILTQDQHEIEAAFGPCEAVQTEGPWSGLLYRR